MKSTPPATRKPQMAGRQRFSVEQARALIARTPKEIIEADGVPFTGDGEYAYAWGRLKPFVADLIAIIDEIAGSER